MAKFIMVVGTASNSGKTVLVSGICRMLVNQGYKVAPFKSQNMSLNSRVSVEDGEIAVAQYTQAIAAKVNPSIHFNPVLLKPKGNFISQVIVHGKPYKDMDYNEYRKEKNYFLEKIKESIEYLDKNYDYVVIEGAGSCCEINLLNDDIANLKVAELSNADAILVSDIDRGGVFASIYGTVNLLPENWKKLLKGFVINKFRGNIDVLKDGFEKIEELTNIPVIGTIPYDETLVLPEEDSQAIQGKKVFGNLKSPVEVNIVKFSKIANFTDLDPLSNDCLMKYIDFNDDITGDILILPGTRCSTVEMNLMKKYGLDKKIHEFINKGGIIFGICGGYQTLGKILIDENFSEGNVGTISGLDVFNMETTFGNKKAINNSNGILKINDMEYEVSGYELHEGYSVSKETPLITLSNGFGNLGDMYDGSFKQIENSYIFGTYLHGILENFEFRNYLVNLVLSKKNLKNISKDNYEKVLQENMDKLSKIIEESIDFSKIL
ncbi:cobyric acid synthase CobQ [Methanococcus vannielii SB]|uniref:Probable cobyric acid synthase n=1 Tax=Methanococcus vannielii (strain ATCC 35089 / DSM 1224 / JCM 13029 / OCM 148 / SB) TaxID=406327 RepID=COBQ_METVS|nr:cobyric acid synthase CobQ [Methanococcus vannielii]A6UPL5.1 RecName: Full=Probable cobyric acid synthase [Methanococcus vannielii SB]ABR54437.1 cobyric acid synthase CobQ [Methanococcus vannielii SB]